MAEYLSPGVYVEEYDNSPRSIEGVGTSAAGFCTFFGLPIPGGLPRFLVIERALMPPV